MSTEWGIGCRDCAPPPAERSEDHAAYFTGRLFCCYSYAFSDLEVICRAAPEVLALHDKISSVLSFNLNDLQNDRGWSEEILAFLVAHRGHRVAPMAEDRMFDWEDWR